MKCKQISDFYFFRQIIFIFFISLLFVQSGFAASVSKLYESSVKVDSSKGEEQGENQLIAEAFTHVLIKVSGRSDVAALPGYRVILKKAESAISQFRYDYKASPSDNISADHQQNDPDNQKQEKEKWFWVRFNSQTVNHLLKEAQIPVWGKIRPETLIWFSQETRGKRYLKSQYDEPEIYAVFKQQADQRGISLIFPFLDLQDRSSVSVTDIWGNFNDAVLLASKRYQAQSTLTARLFRERSGLWVSRWNLLMLGEMQSWEIRDEKLERVLASGIDKLADKLSRQFTQVMSEGSDTAVLVQINNIGGYKDFQALDDYFRNLATVKSIALMQVEHDKVIYKINYLSSKSSLIQEIRLGDLLNSVERSGVDNKQYYNSNTNDGTNGNSIDNSTDNNAYKPVILDDLGKNNSAQGKTTAQMNSREKALDSLDKPDSKIDTAAEAQTTQTVPPVEQEKIVEQLLPELEYWLSR